MKEEKSSMGLVVLMAMGSIAAIGCKYMMCHPELKRNMKNMMKSATKRIYKMLDEMD